jgi:hypothetical protein
MNRALRWYYRQSPNRRATIRWWVPLLLGLVLVQLDWVYRHSSGVASQGTARALLTRVGIVLIISMCLKAALTRVWTLQDLGKVLTLIGVGGLFIFLFARQGPQPTPEWARDYIHALLEVGSTMIILGLILHLIARLRLRRRRSHYNTTTYDRRKGDRRSSTPSDPPLADM